MKKTPHIPAADHAESTLFANIRTLIESARNTVARGVDLVQVHTNFEIGRHIVEFEQQGEGRAEYGTQMLKSLAERLTAEFGSGFSATNLKLMRQFYALHPHRMGQTASGLFETRTRTRTWARCRCTSTTLTATSKPTPKPPPSASCSARRNTRRW